MVLSYSYLVQLGTELVHEVHLLDLPTAVCTFMMDTNEPAVAVSSGTNVFIYKTIRPYFKFTLPLLEVLWHHKLRYEYFCLSNYHVYKL